MMDATHQPKQEAAATKLAEMEAEA